MGRYISNASSYQDNELLLLKQGIAKNHKEFLTAGADTWTIDHDVIVRVRVWGGGGGGGGGYYYDNGTNVEQISGGGGGAGGAAEAILRLSAGTYNITVGDGGAGGKNSTQTDPSAAASGTRGGSSSFHTYITCSGGMGGSYGNLGIPVSGGPGGTASFNWSGFDGLLYANGQLGGNGGSFEPGYYVSRSSSGGQLHYFRFGYGPGKGEGESGGRRGAANQNDASRTQVYFRGGGGGGYNAPFIYGVDKTALENSGRGVGTGGAGGPGYFAYVARPGQPGAVVIEWN